MTAISITCRGSVANYKNQMVKNIDVLLYVILMFFEVFTLVAYAGMAIILKSFERR